MAACTPTTLYTTSQYTTTSLFTTVSTATRLIGGRETVTLTSTIEVVQDSAIPTATVTCQSSSSSESRSTESSTTSTPTSSSTTQLPPSSSTTPSSVSSSADPSSSSSPTSTSRSSLSSSTVLSTNSDGVIVTVITSAPDTTITSYSSSATAQSSSKTATIVGASVGGGIGLIILLALLFGLIACLKRRKREREEKAGLDIFESNRNGTNVVDFDHPNVTPPNNEIAYDQPSSNLAPTVERQPTISTMASQSSNNPGMAGFGTGYVTAQSTPFDNYQNQQPVYPNQYIDPAQQHQQVYDNGYNGFNSHNQAK